MSYERFPNWVPNDAAGNRQDTAVLLVGTAHEHGLTVRHHVASTQGGFYVTDELVDLAFEAEDEDVQTAQEAEAKPAKKTSGNRAAKNTSQEGEKA